MDTFAIAELAEEVAGEIYDILATYFADRPALRDLFAKLAEEEREHAQRVRDLAKLWQAADGSWQPALDVARMTRLVERAREFRDSLRLAEVIEPYDAIRLAASIENDFNAAHAEAMARERNVGVKALFEELARGDAGHNVLLAYLADVRRHGKPQAQTASRGRAGGAAVIEAEPAQQTPTVVVPEKYQRWLKGAEEQLRKRPTAATVVAGPPADKP